MDTTDITLEIVVSDEDADGERLEVLTRSLIRDLRELGVLSVQHPEAGPLAPGQKGIGRLPNVLSIAVPFPLTGQVVDELHRWARRGQRTVTIKTPKGQESLEFKRDTALTNQERDMFVRKLTNGSP